MLFNAQTWFATLEAQNKCFIIINFADDILTFATLSEMINVLIGWRAKINSNLG